MRLDPLDWTPACVAGLELAVFHHDRRPDSPVVLVTHGLAGSLVDALGLARLVHATGLTAVAFEQRNHGRRLVDARRQRWSPEGDDVAEGLATVLGTARDATLLIDTIPACLGLTPRTWGMAGISLGGRATLTAMAHEPRLAAGAAMVACDYLGAWRHRCRLGGLDPDRLQAAWSPALRDLVTRADVLHDPRVFADRPLLLVAGGRDEVVPQAAVEGVHAALAPHYRQHGRLALDVRPEMEHAVPEAVQRDAVAFLAHWLRRVD